MKDVKEKKEKKDKKLKKNEALTPEISETVTDAENGGSFQDINAEALAGASADLQVDENRDSKTDTKIDLAQADEKASRTDKDEISEAAEEKDEVSEAAEVKDAKPEKIKPEKAKKEKRVKKDKRQKLNNQPSEMTAAADSLENDDTAADENAEDIDTLTEDAAEEKDEMSEAAEVKDAKPEKAKKEKRVKKDKRQKLANQHSEMTAAADSVENDDTAADENAENISALTEDAAEEKDGMSEAAEVKDAKPEKVKPEKVKKEKHAQKGKEPKLTYQPSETPEIAKPVKAYTGGLKAVSAILHILSFLIIIGLTSVLAVKSYMMVPYYTFWPFVGVIFMGVLALIFMIVTLTVTRKSSLKSIRRQTVSIVITFFCLTGGFGILLSSAFPDLIADATQQTVLTDDIYFRGNEEAEEKAGLVRQFIRYNILNGNYDPKYSYKDILEHDSAGNFTNENVQAAYEEYNDMFNEPYEEVFTNMGTLKKEFYDFIYNDYILMDYEYAFSVGRGRQAVALAYCDQVFSVYQQLCKEGMSNERISHLLHNNFVSMDQDGYLTYDDPLLLYAQIPGRMTVPVVLRLILDSRYTYTQPDVDEEGNIVYDGYLYEIYDPEAYNDYVDEGGEFNEEGFGINDNGWIIYENGIVKKPMQWIVLDMDGNDMSVVEGIDMTHLNIAGYDIGGIVQVALSMGIGEILGDLLTDGGSPDRLGIDDLIKEAAGGAALNVQIYLDDDSLLCVSVVPNNVKNGVLGYMQMSWLNSDNMLFAVINLVATRETLYIFGAVGLVLLIIAGMCREQAEKRKALAIKRAEKEAEKEMNDMLNEAEENAETRAEAGLENEGETALKDAIDGAEPSELSEASEASVPQTTTV